MVKIEGITKSFQNTTVLDHLSMTIEDGSLCLIQGTNGCGKSTLLKLISGLITVDSGNIQLKDNITIGALIENPCFIENQTMKFNLKFLADLTKRYDERKVKLLCDRLNIDFDEKKPIRKFSLGMRQKAGIIQAIMENQDLILLDEPTRGLDQESVQQFCEIIEQLHNEKKTIIICAHDGVSQIKFTDIYKMEYGKIFKL